jgi:hypothetical protein
LAVISARFSFNAKELWIAALDALADRNEIFFPIFATDAYKNKVSYYLIYHQNTISPSIQKTQITAATTATSTNTTTNTTTPATTTSTDTTLPTPKTNYSTCYQCN